MNEWPQPTSLNSVIFLMKRLRIGREEEMPLPVGHGQRLELVGNKWKGKGAYKKENLSKMENMS